MLEVSEVETMFAVGATPWHQLGVTISEAPTIAEGIKLAGMDWTADKHEIKYADGTVSKHVGIRRSDNGYELGVMKSSYTPLQNSVAFAQFEPFIASGEASLHTAGCLRKGQRVWILAKLNRDPMDIVDGDAVRKFILLSNAHDGTLAVRLGFTPIRVVCANTLRMSHSQGHLVRVRHSAKVVENVEKVAEIINAADAEFEATAEQYRALARKNINQADLAKYVKLVLLGKETPDAELATRTLNTIQEVIDRHDIGLGSEIKGVRGTLWGAYNAVAEYLNYSQGRNEDNRLNSLWFGENAATNQLAFDTALAMAA